jgi:hypothetical protein
MNPHTTSNEHLALCNAFLSAAIREHMISESHRQTLDRERLCQPHVTIGAKGTDRSLADLDARVENIDGENTREIMLLLRGRLFGQGGGTLA